MTKAKRPDSITLFLAQTTHHSDELALLLAVVPGEAIDPGVMERSLLSSGMLAQSASLLELSDFAAMLGAFQGLLTIYRDRNAYWDERIAQVTSELIEKEEQLSQASESKSTKALATAVVAEEWQALRREIEELVLHAEVAPTATPTDAEPSTTHRSLNSGTVDDVQSREQPLAESLNELWDQAVALIADWNESPWDPTTLERDAVAMLRRRLFLVSFYAQSIQQVLTLKSLDAAPPQVESLAPVRCAMEDFARVLSTGDDREIDIRFVGESSMDSRLLSPLIHVLQHMIRDTYLRCSDARLEIEVVVDEQHGGLLWSLKDNGSSRVSDSAVDREEYLAFYPGLKEVRRILGRLNSLLWVEPSDNKGTRFSFTTPESPDGDRFMVWSHGAKSFAVIPSEIGDIVTAEEANVKSDPRGEYLERNGERVPLLKLGHLYEGAPTEGGLIIVGGFLERRVAFHADGESRLTTGNWTRTAVTAWKGLKGVAQIDNEKVPVVETDALLASYIDLISESTEQGVGGGINGDVADLPELRMMDDKESQEKESQEPPPVNSVDPSDAEVLVVERSEAVRTALATILQHRHLRTRLVGQVEDAIDCLDQADPSIIISEFRAPSMAAKVLVERLRATGKSIPVLVTTTQQGSNADLLVQKLGAAGYISKPLDRGQVLSRVSDLIDALRAAAGKT